ncbi:MAG: ABC transporter ATP-binding protein, partial [Spongiibacteraceae bacterium]
MSVLDVDNLTVAIRSNGQGTPHGRVQAVRGVSFAIDAGETLAIVGESGCGKTMTALAVMGLLPDAAEMHGAITLENRRIDRLDTRARNRLRGSRIGMVFQNPMSSLNPTMRVGEQIAEVLVTHRGLGWDAAHQRAITLLDRMQVRDAAARARQYPFEFSGGMLQRTMIAMSLACSPEVLIADEPTTALDVTIQAQILLLLRDLQETQGLSIILITHDLGVVAR